jgi:hypothetical protein
VLKLQGKKAVLRMGQGVGIAFYATCWSFGLVGQEGGRGGKGERGEVLCRRGGVGILSRLNSVIADE